MKLHESGAALIDVGVPVSKMPDSIEAHKLLCKRPEIFMVGGTPRSRAVSHRMKFLARRAQGSRFPSTGRVCRCDRSSHPLLQGGLEIDENSAAVRSGLKPVPDLYAAEEEVAILLWTAWPSAVWQELFVPGTC